ncbi:glycosyltransferase [Pseudoclavibacter sp. CFCC 11306]|uniref:glycosyltransferase n=1 Tax=Pseudoclavibacter sp. CFCC 11306 TaxID=1564493 RepID=UPI001CE4A9C5|nr:glycosyltransferase [Pseudoclavibacter sp. CFCC 11306]
MREQLQVSDRFVVGHFGRFVEQKNHLFLIDVFSEVLKTEPEAVLVLAGDGPLVDRVMSYARQKLPESSFLYLGIRSDTADLYQALDAFVLPSLYEGVPGTGIEAQAAGLPFIFSDAVTDEALIIDSAQRLPLTLGASQWAKAICAHKGDIREDQDVRMREAGYEVSEAAENLARYYERLVEDFI